MFTAPKHFLVNAAVLTTAVVCLGCATMGAKLAYKNGLEEEARGCKESYSPAALIELEQCERISRLIPKAGIRDGYVGYDAKGRISLKGAYDTEDDVDRAFIIAQTVVGAHATAISDITPRNIGVIKMTKQAELADEPDDPDGKKYALLIGVSKFKNGFAPIPAAERDARDFATVLKQQGFERVEVLVNEQATRSAILSAFKQMVSQARPIDRVILYFSTHGTPPDKLGKLGIVPYDLGDGVANLAELKKLTDNPNASDEDVLRSADLRYRVLKTAITPDDLNGFLTGLRAGRSLAVYDTCYSGAALTPVSQPMGGARYVNAESAFGHAFSTRQIAEMAGESGSKDLQVEDASPQPTARSGAATGGKIADYDLKQLPVPKPDPDARTQSGRVVVAASSGHEVSRFDNSNRTPIRNSFFTYYFLNGLTRLNGQTAKAFEYASVRTQYLVSALTNATQTPQMRSSPQAGLNIDIFNK